MAKLLAIFVILFAVVVSVMALAIGLTSASASLANGVANAAASTALMTSQCVTGFMVVVSLVAGTLLGIGISILRGKTLPQTGAQPRWVSGPNARWQRIGSQPVPHQLPAPQAQPAERQVYLVADVEETQDDLPLNGWGF